MSQRSIALSLLLTLCLALTPPIDATCGGGGGGGGGSVESYSTTWLSLPQAQSKANEESLGILYYFTTGEKEEHPVFKGKTMSEQSLATPMVKLSGQEEEKLRALYHLDEGLQAILITDWHGNLVRPFPLKKKEQSRVKFKNVQAVIRGAKKFEGKLAKKATSRLKKGEKNFEKEKWRTAIQELTWVSQLHGFAEVEKATTLLEDLVSIGMQQVEVAQQKDPGEAKKLLRKVAKEFKGTEVEQAAQEALTKLGVKSAQVPAAHRQGEWLSLLPDFEFDPVDEVAIARADLVQRLVEDGARAEREHRYADAQSAYEAAAQLDPKDPVPLRYLGEFHRHHTGDWDLARHHFERLLGLDREDSYSRAIALHGIGKMTIHGGEFEKGVGIIEESIDTFPTQLAYRNLAVYWNSEGQLDKARGYTAQALALDPTDPYTRVFAAVYIAIDGELERAFAQLESTPFDLSMSYNVACIYSVKKDKERTLHHLRRHFYDYEFTDEIRAKEMWEARSDINFRWLHQDPEFLQLTGMAQEK